MRASVMRAAVTSGFGGPERLEVLDDVAVPEPAAGEVLVEVGACCCNNSDIWLREGSYGREDDSQAQAGWLREVEPPRFPLIQGADIVGRIVETGEGVEQGWLGRRVLVDTTLHDAASTEPYGIAGIFGSERDGGFAEYATAPVTSLGVVEVDDLSDVEVAALGSASFVTAIRMLKRARLVEGELVLIAGASGGVGSAAVQLGKLRGAQVIALSDPGKANTIRDLGADAVVASRDLDLPNAVRAACAGRNIDVVVDVVGGPLFSILLTLLRPLGRYVTVGAVGGPVVALDLRTLYLKHLELLGSTLGTVDDFHQLIALINQHKLRPVVAQTFPLEDIHAAQTAFRNKQTAGNIVIRIARERRDN
ncbi:MAG: zinc-binding dehydrogenase [Acidimicrobiia bacterium]|nr:zinc-binding dehydrogenase [Acidimicrobiia bacterium]